MVERLPEDHENAEKMRLGLEALGVRVDRGGILTNIVNLDVSPVGWNASPFADRLNGYGIKVKVCSEHTLRMVTHNDIQSRDISFILDTVGNVLREGLRA
jgi:threonine aldolase